MRSATVFSLIVVMVLGIYILPSVTAKFTGSHSWEVNRSGGPSQLKCGRCHIYIRDEMAAAGGTNVSNSSAGNAEGSCTFYNDQVDVVCAHINASRNANFTGTNRAINITTDTTRDWDTVCHMCHVLETGASVGAQHTRVTIRVCTDCHGSNNSVGRINTSRAASYSPWGRPLCNATQPSGCSEMVVGPRLASNDDLHNNFFVPLEALSSGYAYESSASSAGAGSLGGDGNYTAGWYACLGCHTHVGVQMTLRRSGIFYFNITATATYWSATAPIRNTTAVNITDQFATAPSFTVSKWY